MKKAEQMELARVVRLRAKIAKEDLEQHGARLIAEAEAQLAAIYPNNHPAWAEITERVEKLVLEADAEIAARCRDLGIPERFRPSINYGWYGRGENAMHYRRDELRKVARTKVVARVKAGKVEIERWSVERQTKLVEGALESEDAKAFLETLPSAESLLPSAAELLPDINQLKLGEAPGEDDP